MPTDDQFRALEKKVEQLTAQVSKLQDTQAVRDLQYKYGYYLDKCLYDEVVDLFTDDCKVHSIGGIFRGNASARRLYYDAAGHHRHLARRQNRLCPPARLHAGRPPS